MDIIFKAYNLFFIEKSTTNGVCRVKPKALEDVEILRNIKRFMVPEMNVLLHLVARQLQVKMPGFKLPENSSIWGETCCIERKSAISTPLRKVVENLPCSLRIWNVKKFSEINRKLECLFNDSMITGWKDKYLFVVNLFNKLVHIQNSVLNKKFLL